MTPLRVFIGYDPREAVAFHVLAHSILRRASVPVSIIPIARHHVVGIHTRPRGPLDSTDFSITRFLVPYLSGYEGAAVFMDCDMLCRADIAELFDYVSSAAVYVAKHDYTPIGGKKFLDQQQTTYSRKNWSSVMLFNNAECKALTREYVNEASGLDLHQFRWLEEDMIGGLPLEWNWLVGEDDYPYNPFAKLLHFTRGGPWFADFINCDHADEWRLEKRRMEHAG